MNTWRSSQDRLPVGPFEDHPDIRVGTDQVRAVVKAAVVEMAERDQVVRFRGSALAPVHEGPSSVQTGRTLDMIFGADLHWLPLGAGGWFVRLNGRVYEACDATISPRTSSPSPTPTQSIPQFGRRSTASTRANCSPQTMVQRSLPTLPRNPYPRTPAMAAGLADHVWKIEEIVALLDA